MALVMRGGMRAYASAPAAIANRGTWTVTAIDRHGQLNVTPRPGDVTTDPEDAADRCHPWPTGGT